jgi:hypothetical protein
VFFLADAQTQVFTADGTKECIAAYLPLAVGSVFTLPEVRIRFKMWLVIGWQQKQEGTVYSIASEIDCCCGAARRSWNPDSRPGKEFRSARCATIYVEGSMALEWTGSWSEKHVRICLMRVHVEENVEAARRLGCCLCNVASAPAWSLRLWRVNT